MAIQIMQDSGMSLRRSLYRTGCSRTMWYHIRRDRKVRLDPAVTGMTREIGTRRPSYGTRRMAAMLSRHLGRPVNRKQVRRIFHKLNWIEPARKKAEIMRGKGRLVRPTRPDELWEADMSYIWCGMDGWCYLFNVIDTFTRRWVAYAFDVSATKESAIQSITNAVSSSKVDTGRLTLRVDNGSQYRSRVFIESTKVLGIRLEFIFANTPEQNGHVESFHKTLKKEYLWPYDFQNYQEAEIAIGKAFADYNQSRIHSALGYMTPEEFLREWEMTNK